MNLRWLWFNHFPQDLELTSVERAKARRMAAAHLKIEPQFFDARRQYMKFFIPLIVFAVVVMIVGMIWRKHLPVPSSLLYGVIFYPGLVWGIHRMRRPFIRKALNDLGHPVCIPCGYLLIGLPNSERCPECGEPRVQTNTRVLTPPELANPEVVQTMVRLGYAVCWRCGAMWFERKDALVQCPTCRTAREPISQDQKR